MQANPLESTNILRSFMAQGVNQHFNRAHELLLRRPDSPVNWQFLSISFDPNFDRPGVLTRYAYSHRG